MPTDSKSFKNRQELAVLVELIKEHVAPYAVAQYQRVFGDGYRRAIRSALTTAAHAPSDAMLQSAKTIVQGLDAQGSLNLLQRRWRQLFKNYQLGEEARQCVRELVAHRNMWAHQEDATDEDVYRAADATQRLMHAIGAEAAAGQARLLAKDFDPFGFAPQIRAVNSAIIRLTEEQFSIIDELRGCRRIAIGGCAGSGKTLVAAEKALRLDTAGFCTLLLCQNPRLAAYLRSLTKDAEVDVYDFGSWVSQISSSGPGDAEWTIYHEPTEEEINSAFDIVVDEACKYDAVIVDEGQDFRDEWWALVEAALNDPRDILYIFYDDSQRVHSRSTTFPADIYQKKLSRNCRNSGAVFNLVKALYRDQIEAMHALQHMGFLTIEAFVGTKYLPPLQLAISEATQGLRVSGEVVVLTTEPDPSSSSRLNGVRLREIIPPTGWQKEVLKCLRQCTMSVHHSVCPYVDVTFDLPKLSSDSLPSPADVAAVRRYVSAFISRHGNIAKELTHRKPKKTLRWSVVDGRLHLHCDSASSAARTLRCFLEDWQQTIPIDPPRTYTLTTLPQTPTDVLLSSVAEYKGLEADIVILFVPYPSSGLSKELLSSYLYIGASRAKYGLQVIIDQQLRDLLPEYLDDADEGTARA